MEKVMSDGNGTAKEIDLRHDFGALVVEGSDFILERDEEGNITVDAQGNITACTDGTVNRQSSSHRWWPRESQSAATAPEIGAIESTGEHKGKIYGGILPRDNKPIWFLTAPKLMNHYKAAAWATEQGGALPTFNQGDYLTTLKGEGGALTEMFNRGVSIPAGYVWLAEPYSFNRSHAWCQRLSDGGQNHFNRYTDLPVLSVFS
jgi:hypothetical protein